MAMCPQGAAGVEINKKSIWLDDYRWKSPCKDVFNLPITASI